LEPGGEESSPFLGAQVVVGRWVLPTGNMPPPHPCDHVVIRNEAVVTASYQRVPNWRRLERAEEEAAALIKEWGAESHPVDATFDDVMDCLHGHPAADLLHFALHGQFDLAGLQDGLVLVEKQPDASSPSRPTFLRPDQIASSTLDRAPFVFLNSCQVGAAREVLGDYAGLVESFLFAGASAVVAPLWSIDDGDAKNLALEFYKECWMGEAPAEILRKQRARFTESAARQAQSQDGSPTHLAYQFFGHPKFTLERHE
jgi:CHAT domain-containing protein